MGLDWRNYLGLTLQGSFPFFSQFAKKMQIICFGLTWSNLFIILGTWNAIIYLDQLISSLAPFSWGELARSRGLRETTLSWLWGGFLWGLGFLIPVRVVRCCGTHSALRTRTRCGERWDLLLDQTKRSNKWYFLHPQDLPCLEDEARSLLRHSSVPRGTIVSRPIDFRGFGKKIRRVRFHGLPSVWEKRQKNPVPVHTQEMSGRHRDDVEAPEMGLAPGFVPHCAMPGAPAYTLLISVA